jgi:mannose-6-phosphate isomerase-like protein (cupin superfamily)
MAHASGVRRVVTTHDKSGKAIVMIDDVPGVAGGEPELRVETRLLWVTDETPVNMSTEGDAGKRAIGIPPPPNGTIFRIVEFAPMSEAEEKRIDPFFLEKKIGHTPAPGAKPPRHPGMHRTRSIDFIVVMSGEITMLLDDSEVHLKAGDTLIQRGTIHAWVNRGKEVCRIAVVLVDAEEPDAWKKK